MARVSMNELTTYRWSFEEDVRRYHAAGYDGIGVWREKLTDCGEENAIGLLAEMGLQVSTLSWAGGFTGSDGRSHVEAVEDALDAVRLAARLRADCLIVHSGARGGHTHSHVRRLFREALKQMLAAAESLDVTIALEPMHPGCAADWTFLNGLDEALDLIEAGNSSHLRLALDTYHMGHDRAILHRLEEIAQYVTVVQLGDARQTPQGEPNRCPLGKGIVPLNQFLATLLGAGFDGFFDIELVGEEIESADYNELLVHSRQAFEDLMEAAKAS
jgi:sugar phosphate isomerase/epimerase